MVLVVVGGGAFSPLPLQTIIVNPSGKASFVPLNVEYILDRLINEDSYVGEDDDDDESEKSSVFELYKLDKETKRYELKEVNDSDNTNTGLDLT